MSFFLSFLSFVLTPQERSTCNNGSDIGIGSSYISAATKRLKNEKILHRLIYTTVCLFVTDEKNKDLIL